MRTLALLFILTSPYLAAASVPANHKARVAVENQPIRVSLVNLSSHSRQIRLKSGLVELPSGLRVDIDSHVGATLLVVSSTDVSLHEEIRIAAGDDSHLLSVR